VPSNSLTAAKTTPKKPAELRTKISTTGDLRAFIANVAMGVVNGDVKVDQAVAAIKAGEVINDSLYSETKLAAMQILAGKEPTQLGALSIRGPAEA